LAICAALFAAAPASADVYKYKDEHGNVLYTDKPSTLPAERLNVQSQKTDVVAVQARQQAEASRQQAAAAATQQPQRTDPKTAQAMAADKAEQCKKARERYDTYMNSQRLFKQGANGEREYLSDAELDAARASAKSTMDEFCK
jgi:hypothetical protein